MGDRPTKKTPFYSKLDLSHIESFCSRGGYGDRDRRSPPRRNRGPTVGMLIERRVPYLKDFLWSPY